MERCYPSLPSGLATRARFSWVSFCCFDGAALAGPELYCDHDGGSQEGDSSSGAWPPAWPGGGGRFLVSRGGSVAGSLPAGRSGSIGTRCGQREWRTRRCRSTRRGAEVVDRDNSLATQEHPAVLYSHEENSVLSLIVSRDPNFLLLKSRR